MRRLWAYFGCSAEPVVRINQTGPVQDWLSVRPTVNMCTVAGRLPPWLPGDPCPAPCQTSGVDQPICSAKGCRAPAAWALSWNNPKIHTPDRRKTWLACPEHREHLSQFLSARGFLRETDPLGAAE
jgi:hypothetical protein